jgi:hypothetical protein
MLYQLSYSREPCLWPVLVPRTGRGVKARVGLRAGRGVAHHRRTRVDQPKRTSKRQDGAPCATQAVSSNDTASP